MTLVYRVTQLDLIPKESVASTTPPDTDLVKVTLFAPTTGDDRRSGSHVIIVPLDEAQTFYNIGSEFHLDIVPKASERVTP